MKKLLVITLLLSSFNTYAACSRQSLQGEYAASWLVDTEIFGPLTTRSTHMLARMVFNASGKVTVANGTGTAQGASRKFTGGGSFNVSSNCSGTASINLRNSEGFRLRLQLYFIAGGSPADTEISAVFENKEEGRESGHMHLKQINL